MGIIKYEFRTKYDEGDVVVFEKDNEHKVGIVESYTCEVVGNMCYSIWYTIRISKNIVYSFSNKERVSEFDIIGKLEGDLKTTLFSRITGRS